MTGLYLPANLSRQELIDMLRRVPVNVNGVQSNLLDSGEEIRTGRLVLSAGVPGSVRTDSGPAYAATQVPHVNLLQCRNIPALIHGTDLKDALFSVKFTLDGMEGHDLLNCAARIGSGDIALTGTTRGQQMAQPPQVASEDRAPLFPHKTPEQLFAGDIPSMLYSSDVLAALQTVPVETTLGEANLLEVAEDLKAGTHHLVLVPDAGSQTAVSRTGIAVTDDSVTVQRPGGRVTVTVDL